MTLMTGIAIYNEEQVIRALRNQLGNLALTAAELGVRRGELMDYIVNHPVVLQEKNQIKEAFKDEAEQLLVKKMQTDNNLLIFFLRTQAADRGYGTNTTVSGPNGKPIEVNVNARTLIAAMRTGAQEDIEPDEEESEDQSIDLLEQSGIFSGGVGSGGDW